MKTKKIQKPGKAKKSESEYDAKRKAAKERLRLDMRARVFSRHEPPKLKVKNKSGEASAISVVPEDKGFEWVSILDTFGTTSIPVQSKMMCALINAVCEDHKDNSSSELEVNALVSAMHGIHPRDEVESMLAAQMIATHFNVMRVLRQLKNSQSIDQQDSNGNLVTKLMRTYTAQVEALQRYRGKGQQKMTVEHVHIHPGAQAIVGNVTQSTGDGAKQKTEEQPHAKQIEHAPMQEMSSQNTKRHQVPVPCDA